MPQPFEYYRPKTRAEALELLAHSNLQAVPLIVPPKPSAPRRRGADAFVDLSLLDLDYIRVEQDGSVHIGALTTLQEMVESPALSHGTRILLSRAARLVAGPGIRNLSGMWGAIQARSGPPEVVLALLALEAQVVLLGVGERRSTLSLPEYYALDKNSVHKGELVLEVLLPPEVSGCGWALERVSRTPRDEAIVAAAVVVGIENSKTSRVILALAGANALPVRLSSTEDLLTGTVINAQTLQTASETVMAQADPIGDFRGSREYRCAMAGLVIRRSLVKAYELAISQEKES